VDDLYLMTVFVAVGDGLSFSSAGRRLDLSPATVTRAIQALESRRGVNLFLRRSRRVELSEAGKRYLEDARSILQLVAKAEEAVSSSNAVARGCLRVTAPVIFGRLYVVPGISDYLARFPDMKVSASFVDRTVNLIDEGFDVAVRIGQLPDSGMRALKVGEVVRSAYASPDYLSRHGEPRHPIDLQGHRTITTDVLAQSAVWKFGSRESPILVKLVASLGVTGGDAAIAAATLGLGIVYLPNYQVKEEVKNRVLQPILQDFSADAVPIHLLHRESRYGSSKIRNFIDLLAERLRIEHWA
jgi:DNA-binding transcriptional LysR family regulator